MCALPVCVISAAHIHTKHDPCTQYASFIFARSLSLSTIGLTRLPSPKITPTHASPMCSRYLDHEPASMDELATPLHATITGLLPFTAYDVRVRAVHGRGVSGFTTAGVVTAEDVPSRPAAPLVLEVRQRAVRVNINAPTPANGRIVAYDVQIVETRMETPGRRPLTRIITLPTNGDTTTTNNNNTTTNATINTNAREYTSSDLRPATPYNVSVRGVTSAVAGPFSAPALVTTLPAAR